MQRHDDAEKDLVELGKFLKISFLCKQLINCVYEGEVY